MSALDTSTVGLKALDDLLAARTAGPDCSPLLLAYANATTSTTVDTHTLLDRRITHHP